MKKHLVFLALALAVASTDVFPETTEWKGFYVGPVVSGAYHTPNWTDIDFDWNGATLSSPYTGLMYGVVVGYNFQAGSVLYGIELDLNASSMDGFTRFARSVDKTDELERLYMLKGRAGITIGNALLFFTAGLAKPKAEHTWIEDADPMDSWPTFSNEKIGWVIGFGGEHKFSKRVSLRFEYLNVEIPAESSTNQLGFTMEVDEEISLLHVGVNFHF